MAIIGVQLSILLLVALLDINLGHKISKCYDLLGNLLLDAQLDYNTQILYLIKHPSWFGVLSHHVWISALNYFSGGQSESTVLKYFKHVFDCVLQNCLLWLNHLDISIQEFNHTTTLPPGVYITELLGGGTLYPIYIK